MAILTENEYHAALARGEDAFRKKCRFCGGEYFSSSRNTRYCSDECSRGAAAKNRKLRQKRERKRKEYDENREINRALSKAYSLCQTVMELYQIPKRCACESDECSGELERHHIDCNPFNNSPWNLTYLCKRHHALTHAGMVSVNWVETFNEALKETEGLDDSERYRGMVEVTRRRLEGIDGESTEGE